MPAETHSEHLHRGVDQPHSELNAKQQKLAEQQRLNRGPPVKRVNEKDVTAALAQLRALLQSDV